MKTSLQFFAIILIAGFMGINNANAQCILYTNGADGRPASDNTWQTSEYYQVLRLDASTLTDATLYPRTGAVDGSDDNFDYTGSQDVRNPLASGEIVLPTYNSGANVDDIIASPTYSVKYHNCVFAPDHYGSAYTKQQFYGSTPSGGTWRAEEGTTCTVANDNTEYITNLFDQPGFIELSRAGATEAEPEVSRHGYIQLDNLRRIDKIQWFFSSTAWKRGVMVETKYEDEEEWTIKRSLPSNQEPYAAYSDQGYTFEESFSRRDDRVFSFRIRIWDGDQISFRDAFDLGERPTGYFYTEVTPGGSWQVARVHRLYVYSSLTADQLWGDETGINDNYRDKFNVQNVNGILELSEQGNVEIYTIDGKLVKTDAGTDINVSDLNSGVYVVKATSQSGITKNVKVAL